MPATRDPILLLEPSNLLEPLNLADRHGDPASPSTSPTSPARTHSAAAAICRPDAAREKLPESVAMGAQRIRRDSFSAPIERDSRWRLKSALLVAGALACVATGTALPQLPELVFGDAKPAQQTKSAPQTVAGGTNQQTVAGGTNQQTVAGATKPSAPVADAPAKSEQSKPAEPKPSDKPSESSGSNQGVAPTTNAGTQPAMPDQPAPAAQDAAAAAATSCGPRNRASDDKCLEGGPAAPAPGPVPTAVPDRNSDGTPGASRTTAASPAKPRTAPQTIWQLDDRSQQSVNRRATPRDAADQQAAADSNGQGARSSDRNAPDRHASDRNASDRNASDRNAPDKSSSDRSASDRSSWDRDRRQDQDSTRTSSRRRERSGDNGQSARYGDSRQEQDFNRNSNWRRDRNDDYDRGEDRRVFGRAPREDDRVIGVGPRHEGPLPIFPSLFGW